MATSGGIWAPIAMRILRHAFNKTSNAVRARIAEVSRPLTNELQPVLVRTSPRQPIHPAARRVQSKGRWYTTHSTINAAFRRFISTSRGYTLKYDRSTFPKSATATAVSRLTTRAPFASTLRPNLTGGAFPRTSGGYSIGGGNTGGARYFSHTPAAPAQVVHNVSAAVRAFWLSGNKAQFDGISPSGENRFRSISNLQDESTRKIKSISKHAAGSFIDFHFDPTITALSPLGAAFPYGLAMEQYATNLNTEGFLDVLSVDFSRVLQNLAATMNDLKRLSSLGDLPVTLEERSVLRVRFPGCDAESVERLCDEMGVQRGHICQDPDFDKSVGYHLAMMFPYAPSSELSLSLPGGSLRSILSHNYDTEEISEEALLEGYETMEDISENVSAYFAQPSEHQSASKYEGLEGIYRFLEECDNARRI